MEEAFGISVGTFDAFFPRRRPVSANEEGHSYVPPQHRIKLLKYPPVVSTNRHNQAQGVGAHKDSSGWLTFLYQVGEEEGLQVLHSDGQWIDAPPIPGTFVVNFGNAFEAATEGAVKATVHRVKVCRVRQVSPSFSLILPGSRIFCQRALFHPFLSGPTA